MLTQDDTDDMGGQMITSFERYAKEFRSVIRNEGDILGSCAKQQ